MNNLENSDKIGQFGQNWTQLDWVTTKLDNSDKIRQSWGLGLHGSLDPIDNIDKNWNNGQNWRKLNERRLGQVNNSA